MNFKPLRVFKSFHKYDVKESCINQETYNITKKKLFSKERFSNIKKGLNITKKQFIEEKNNFLRNKISKSIEIKEDNNKILNSFDNNYNITKPDNNNNALYKTINTGIKANKSIFKDPNDYTIEELKSKNIDYIIMPEARGFLFGSIVANELNIGCIPVRKKGKLPP